MELAPACDPSSCYLDPRFPTAEGSLPNRFKIATDSDDVAERMCVVPGIIVRPAPRVAQRKHELIFGRNCLPVVNDALRHAGLEQLVGGFDKVDAALAAKAWARAQLRLRPDAVPWKSYQLPGVAKMLQMGMGLGRWPPGAGKSRLGITLGLGYDGPRIIVTKASNRAGYVHELKQWVVSPTWYIVTGHDNGGEELPPDVDFIICAVETLQWHIGRLVRVCPKVLIIDESDLVRSTQRWKAVPKMEGAGVDWTRQGNRAAAIEDLTSAVEHRFLTTGTLFPNKPKDGYAQGDLLEPGAWGKWSAYAARYCSRALNAWGGVDDSGADHLDELRSRWAAVSHEVTQAEVNLEMPPVRIVPAFIGSDEQPTSEELREELAGADSQERAGLMVASFRALPYVLDKTEESVRAGKKVAIFTGWRQDAERIAKAVAKRLGGGVRRGKKAGAGAGASTGATPIVLVHGGTGDSAGRLDELVPYITATGGAVIIGTWGALGRATDGLQVTQHVLASMLPYTPGELEQGLGRFTRLGRVDSCLIELCVPLGSYAERVASILLDKGGPISRLAPTEVVSALPSILLNGAGADRAFKSIIGGLGLADLTPSEAPYTEGL